MTFYQLITSFTWEQARTIVQTFQSIATITALAVGVCVYYASRKPFPKVTQKHSVIHEFLDPNILWIRVNLEIKNEGLVLLTLQKLDAHIQIITPLMSLTREKIQQFNNRNINNEEELTVDWVSINGREIDLTKTRIRIEPGETEYIFSDFILQDDEDFTYSRVSMILITTNLKLKQKPSRLISLWGKITRRDKDRSYKLSTPYKIEPSHEENNER
jgi:hypothetical protein